MLECCAEKRAKTVSVYGLCNSSVDMRRPWWMWGIISHRSAIREPLWATLLKLLPQQLWPCLTKQAYLPPVSLINNAVDIKMNFYSIKVSKVSICFVLFCFLPEGTAQYQRLYSYTLHTSKRHLLMISVDTLNWNWMQHNNKNPMNEIQVKPPAEMKETE